MTVHENETLTSSIPMAGEPNVTVLFAANAAIESFKTALRELGDDAPANKYRAVLTTSGIVLEVEQAPLPEPKHYGTAAPVEEIAEFLGEAPEPFKVGERIRAVRRTVTWADKVLAEGTELVTSEAYDNFGSPYGIEAPGDLPYRGKNLHAGAYLVDPADFERVS